MIVIRGPLSTVDILRDAMMFNRVAMMQFAGWIVPITRLLPDGFMSRSMLFMSQWEGLIETEVHDQFDNPIFEYALTLLTDATHTVSSLYFVGHSLGGALAQIVGAQFAHFYRHHGNEYAVTQNVEVRSLAVSAPGMLYNAQSFGVNVVDVLRTATVLRPQHDFMSNVDIHGGTVQDLECTESEQFQCHFPIFSVCELAAECDMGTVPRSDMVTQSCLDPDPDASWMEHLRVE